MKWVGVGILWLLPFGYIALMLSTGQPIEWGAVGFMVAMAIALTLFATVWKKRMNAVQEDVLKTPRIIAQKGILEPLGAAKQLIPQEGKTEEANKKSAPATRAVGLVLLFIALLIFGANEFMLLLFNRYFVIILLLSGPFISMGIATIIYPRILDALLGKGHPKWLRWLSIACVVAGILLGIFILLKVHYG